MDRFRHIETHSSVHARAILGGMWRWFKRLTLLLLALCLVLAVVAVALGWPRYREFQQLADGFDLAEIDRIPAVSEIFDHAGQRYSRLDGEVRYVVPLEKISPRFIDALLAREDGRFFEHRGIDVIGIARAAVRNLRAGTVKEGASTITQQLARNTFDLDPDPWRRKCIEALLAMRIEARFSKEQILESYANRIYYGIGHHGVETASRACFGSSAADLTLSEAAILAGLIRSPNRLSPLEDTETALRERDHVLGNMLDLGMITPAEAEAARAESMPLAKNLPPVAQRNYAVDAVIRDLSILLPKDVIRQGGLRIHTTIDRRLQLLAEEAIDEELAKIEAVENWPHPRHASTTEQSESDQSPYLQGALVAIDNESGGIAAVVGGRDYTETPYNRATLAQRQIGSTFKPFVYAAAFAGGLLPGTIVDDGPLTPDEIGGVSWSPQNSDGQDSGPMPAAQGLIRSRNTTTVRVGESAPRAAVRALAAHAGLGAIPDFPSIHLGAFEATLKDLTAAYTMFPNSGVRLQPFIIKSIEDRDGRTIYKATEGKLRCLAPAVAQMMNEILGAVVSEGTAGSAKSLGLTVPAAGKTGTTDDFKDAWFVGYTKRLTCGVWVGFDQPQRISHGGYGSRIALPAWVHFIEKASSFKYEPGNFAAAPEGRKATLCRLSGMLATPECATAGTAYETNLPHGIIPTEKCPTHPPSTLANRPTDHAVPVARAIAVDRTDEKPIRRALPATAPALEPQAIVDAPPRAEPADPESASFRPIPVEASE